MNLLDLIHVPDPCNEDWGKMTPQEKGRHCAKCDKAVVDFTSMSSEEADQELRSRFSAGERVCGHFSSDMLTNGRLLAFFYQMRSGKGLLRRFALSLVFVFGGFLFNGWSASAQKGEVKVRGKIAAPLVGEAEIPEPRIEQGGVSPVQCAPKGNVEIDREYELEGEIMIDGLVDIYPEEDTLVEPEVDSAQTSKDSLAAVIEEMEALEFLGNVLPILPEDGDSSDVVSEEPVTETPKNEEDPEPEDVEETTLIAIEPEKLGLTIHPNPATDWATVRIKVVRSDSYQAVVYNMDGKVVENLFLDKKLAEGPTDIKVNTSDWAPGTYIISVKGAAESISAKLIVR